jgi:hypothetical protein
MNIVHMKSEGFFEIDEKGNLRLNQLQLLEFLTSQGFAKTMDENGKITFIRFKGRIVEQVKPIQIRDSIMEFLKSQDIEGLDCFVKEHQKVNAQYLELLPTVSLDLKQDTKDCAYFFFRNVFVKITRKDFTCHSYDELDGHVWSSQILNHDFHPEEPGDFEKFIRNLSRDHRGELDNGRYQSLRSGIGYLLHRFKDRNNPKAVILMDSGLDRNQANGGSGKTLIAQATGKVRKVRIKDGKHLKNNDKFFYQDVDESIDVLFLDDVSKYFDFSSVFPALTTGIQQERKYQDVKVIPFERSPKILIATNFVLQGPVGVSTERRKFEFELSNHYGLNHQPIDDFHHMFFDDWDEGQWNQFFTFMIKCVRLYLSEGLIDYDRSHLQHQKLIQETCEEFVEYAKSLTLKEEYDRTEQYNNFTFDFDMDISSNLFSRYLQKYCDLAGLRLEKRRSNGKDYFTVH